MNSMKGFEEFQIDQYGSSASMGFLSSKYSHEDRVSSVDVEEQRRTSSPAESQQQQQQQQKKQAGFMREDGVFEKISKFDFIQDTARAGSMELNLLLKMCVDLIVLGCHKNRNPGGPVEQTLERIKKDWMSMCHQCDRLKSFSEERNRAKVREATRRKKKREQEKAQKLDRIYQKKKGGREREKKEKEETHGHNILSRKEQREEKIDRERYLCHGGYGSVLLQATRVSPSALYEDTKNIRRALIWCLMCLSEDIQRLVRCGKFYSTTYKCLLRYAPIQQDALDEFVHLIDPLKNAFYTCQMSAANFVICMRALVEKKGVHHFVKVVLEAARTMETLRIAKTHIEELKENEAREEGEE